MTRLTKGQTIILLIIFIAIGGIILYGENKKVILNEPIIEKAENVIEEEKVTRIDNNKNNIRISADKLNDVLIQIEEMRGIALNSKEHLLAVKELGSLIDLFKHEMNRYNYFTWIKNFKVNWIFR